MNLPPENITDIFERITDAFVVLDNNWCYTYMNKKAGEILTVTL
jgi:PAS domain-containing protein